MSGLTWRLRRLVPKHIEQADKTGYFQGADATKLKPLGTRVVFMKSHYATDAQIWVMKWNGTVAQRIDTGSGYECVPYRSSDGKKIIWEEGPADSRSAIAVDVTDLTCRHNSTTGQLPTPSFLL